MSDKQLEREWVHGVVLGDCLDVLGSMPEDSLDACVTDPPYELGFMGKAWDRAGVSFRKETWAAVLRVLKPGAHLLAFGGTRTFHRIAVAIEDAGFEIRDALSWMYGQGFPKSLDVSKAIDKAAGAPRDKVEGGTAAAWSGWGTALKPGWEPIIMARKPLVGTVAENVLRHGTGGINVEACRLDPRQQQQQQGRYASSLVRICGSDKRDAIYPADLGRWPANVCLDEEAAAMLDKAAGDRPGFRVEKPSDCSTSGITSFDSMRGNRPPRGYDDAGGPSRFFYVAKASRAEREKGCGALPLRAVGETTDREDDSDGLNSPRAGAGRTSGAGNFHPTVKPIKLMCWLVRLVTPPRGHVLDPFTGSGTTGIACDLENFAFTGIEIDPEYATIAQARLAYWSAIPKQKEVFGER